MQRCKLLSIIFLVFALFSCNINNNRNHGKQGNVFRDSLNTIFSGRISLDKLQTAGAVLDENLLSGSVVIEPKFICGSCTVFMPPYLEVGSTLINESFDGFLFTGYYFNKDDKTIKTYMGIKAAEEPLQPAPQSPDEWFEYTIVGDVHYEQKKKGESEVIIVFEGYNKDNNGLGGVRVQKNGDEITFNLKNNASSKGKLYEEEIFK